MRGKTSHLLLIGTALLAWRIWTLVFLFFAAALIPLHSQFLGGELKDQLAQPWFWAWSNFDGENYLSIAQRGYFNLGEQAFFPLYPLLMRFVVWPLRDNMVALGVSGLVISHASFFLGLLGLWKLVRIDFKESTAKFTLLLLLIFPTSFYFGSVYTESLFLALVVWSFYSARRGRWLTAGILGALASSTRFVGIILFPALLLEWWMQKKLKTQKARSARPLQGAKLKSFIPLFIIPIGLFTYMYYLFNTTGDPLAFWHALPSFGEQRSAVPILLPQVFWRYVKIFIDFPKTEPFFFTILLEAGTAVLFLVLSIISFLKLRLSYAVFLFLGYLAPTFSGSFSSLPRYILPLFPAFLLAALMLEKRPRWVKAVVVSFLFLLLVVATSLFVRGYWIA